MLRRLARAPRKVFRKLAPRRRIADLAAIHALARESARRPVEVFKEQRALQRERGITLEEYRAYALHSRDLRPADRESFLPGRPDEQRKVWELMIAEHERAVYHNKLLFNRFFSDRGLPLARLHGILDSKTGWLEGGGGTLRSAEDLGAWLSGLRSPGPLPTGFVVKPVEGSLGQAVHVFEKEAGTGDGRWITLSGEARSPEEIYGDTAGNRALKQSRFLSTRSFLLEDRLLPHRALAELVGPTLCTVRIVTFISTNGRPELLAAAFKVQPGRSGVDHLYRGAVPAGVNLETGVLGPGRKKWDPAWIHQVPGTDVSFVGFALPFWEEVREVALRAQAAFPWGRSIGWDVAITDAGPVLVEGNEWWSMPLVQLVSPHGLYRGGFRELCESLKGR